MSIQSLEGGLAQTALPPYGAIADGATLEQGTGPAVSSDAISLSPSQPETDSNLDQASMLSPLSGMLTQLMQMLQSMLGSSSASLAGMPGQCPTYGGQGGGNCAPGGNGIAHGPEQYFSSAQGVDEGDPHLSFNGLTDNLLACWKQKWPRRLEHRRSQANGRISSDDRFQHTSFTGPRRKRR
jgi:hypothetical protein